MSNTAIAILYLLGGPAIVWFGLLGIARPGQYWGNRWSRSLHFTSEEGLRPLKRIASAFALFGGVVLIAKGFALIRS